MLYLEGQIVSLSEKTLVDLVADVENVQCLHLFTVQEKREELSPGTSVTSCLLAKGYRLDLQVGKCRGTPFSAKSKGLLM